MVDKKTSPGAGNWIVPMQFLFVVLYLTGTVHWSLWWVFSPVIYLGSVFAVIGVLALIYALVKAVVDG